MKTKEIRSVGGEINKLRGLYVLLLIALLLPFFACTGQVPDCDTVYIEDPATEAVIEDLHQSLDSINDMYQLTLDQLDVTLKKLSDCEERPPETVTDTVYVESEYITVNGEEYKVSDIELIVDKEIVDTITVTTCFEDYGDKVWFHVGDPKTYPHRIYFPTKELEIIGIMFQDSLTLDMKRYQNVFKIERTTNHENGTTTYRNLFVDPAEYMP